ncbi:hypothetical protein [Wolbachia endosymbiont of Phyllotreta cruciferae]|uniref:hypothetical protein n=1 Tax=Wolbachia endosymbiont of Phyllotreta cruciferae TaxID=2886377 RepID=UPI00209CBDE6|nr:hypothetical protein [Wolbachia endosymbiont of Phyllotreta cruciferae]
MARIEVIKQKYSQEGLWSATKEVPVQGWNLVKENPYKTAATFVAIAAAISLTAAYFLSPAYAAFVGTVGTKAATLVSPAITAMSTFAVAHPLVASLIVVAAVAALIAAPVYAYKNSSKANQIDAVREEILKVCEKDDDKPKIDNDKLKFIVSDTSTFLNDVAVAVGLVPAKA